MIDAEVRSEERFSRLSLGYDSEDKECVINTTDAILKKHKLSPSIHFTNNTNGKEIMIIEFHDDMDREAGDIFEEIIHTLKITCIL